MNTTKDPLLQRSMDVMAMPHILMDHRLIAAGDERALLPEESAAFATSVIKVQRASGTARIVARGLFGRLGQAARPIPKADAGMPVWPSGIVGSLAHDSRVAVAAIANNRDFLSVGIDVEPAEALNPDLLHMVATAQELRNIHDDPCQGRLLFSVKEAVYKAVYPLDRTFLDHHDVEVSLQRGQAMVRNGRVVSFRYCVATHIVALAFVPASPVKS